MPASRAPEGFYITASRVARVRPVSCGFCVVSLPAQEKTARLTGKYDGSKQESSRNVCKVVSAISAINLPAVSQGTARIHQAADRVCQCNGSCHHGVGGPDGRNSKRANEILRTAIDAQNCCSTNRPKCDAKRLQSAAVVLRVFAIDRRQRVVIVLPATSRTNKAYDDPVKKGVISLLNEERHHLTQEDLMQRMMTALASCPRRICVAPRGQERLAMKAVSYDQLKHEVLQQLGKVVVVDFCCCSRPCKASIPPSGRDAQIHTA